jgi:hypothetical protein
MLVGDSQGRFQEALLLRPAMENLVELADDDWIRASALDSLGTALMGMGKYEDAGKVFGRALALRPKTGPEENLGVASSINNLGAVLFYLGKYEGTWRRASGTRAPWPCRTSCCPRTIRIAPRSSWGWAASGWISTGPPTRSPCSSER